MWKEISGSGLGTTHFQKWGKGEENHSSGRHEWTQRSESSGARIPGRTGQDGISWRGSWHSYGGSLPLWIFFLLRAVHWHLSSPKNLHKCGMRDEPMCKLCGKKTELWHTHLLSGCNIHVYTGGSRTACYPCSLAPPSTPTHGQVTTWNHEWAPVTIWLHNPLAKGYSHYVMTKRWSITRWI